jgi:nucleoside-diphosphate-sugar epimerase
MKQRVLITGASGFVGYHLIESALRKNLDVFVAVRKSSDIRHLQSYQLHYTYPDFSSAEKLEEEIKKNNYSFIVHAAGTTKARTANEYNLVNAGYTVNLAQAIANCADQVQKIVFMSSLGSIGPSTVANTLLNEQAVPTPVTTYGKSKLIAEQQLQQFNLPLVVLRPTAVYGPREKDIFIVLKTINSGLEPYIGKVQQQLSFVYVKDLADLTISALFSEGAGVYNITDGSCYGRYELARITKAVLGKRTFKFHLPYGMVKGVAILLEKGYGLMNKTSILNNEKLNELTALNWCCDIGKAVRELQYEPQYNLERGLTETLHWYKENKWL